MTTVTRKIVDQQLLPPSALRYSLVAYLVTAHVLEEVGEII